MYGEKFYGSNASTFVGIAGVVLGSVSLLAGMFSGGNINILSVGTDNAFANGLVSVASLLIGGALIASRETIGGITSLLLAGVLIFGGMLSINMGQFFKVLAATSDAISQININVDGAGTASVAQVDTSDYIQIRPLTAAERAECLAGTAKWTSTPAGKRNCTGGGVYTKRQP